MKGIMILLNAFWSGPILTMPMPIVTYAQASFKVPYASVKGPNMAEEAYWVGVGGIRKPFNLCQAGVAQSRVDGKISADLIVQDYPNPPIGRYTVHAGNWIAAKAGLINGRYQAVVKDITTGKTLSIGCRVPKGGGWEHAEWIGESRHELGQPILSSSPLVFRQMSVRTTRGMAGFWSLWKEPGTYPYLSHNTGGIKFGNSQ